MSKRFFYFSGLALLALLLVSPRLAAQDTLRVMSYNLLRYGAQGIGGCTPTPVSQRNTWFTNVMTATQPDIFGVNEVGPFDGAFSPASNISLNVLPNVPGKGPFYEATQIQYDGSQDICNMLWYNSAKLGLSRQAFINVGNGNRNLDYYKLYYKSPGTIGDTTFVHVILVHLMASNATAREQQTQAAMNYLDNVVGGAADNYIIMGDMNIDTYNAGAFQNMVAHSNFNTRMRDPLNITVNWSNNNTYDYSWTQSTRSSAYGCGSGGGLDDRFDIILCSNALMNGTEGIQYMPGSYWVPGNPHSPNASVSSTVNTGLVGMSDHYPVIVDLEVSKAVALDPARPDWAVQATSPFATTLRLQIDQGPAGDYAVEVLDLQGRLLHATAVSHNGSRSRTQLEGATPQTGLYVVRVTDSNGLSRTLKVVRIQ